MRKYLRNIITYGALALTPLIGTGCFKTQRTSELENKITQANIELERFPNKIPAVSKITKYETPGAKTTIVHIKQEHYFPPLPRQEPKEEYDKGSLREIKEIKAKLRKLTLVKIATVQKEIYLTLKYLGRKGFVKEIYIEGIVSGENNQLNQKDRLKKYIANQIELIAELEGEKTLETEGKIPVETMIFLAGGAKIFSFLSKGKIELKGAEGKQIHRKAQEIAMRKIFKKIENKNLENIVLEQRENAVLKTIEKKSKNPIVILVYGSAHNFKNNIDEWNSKHPKEKYSLIEIFPKFLQ